MPKKFNSKTITKIKCIGGAVIMTISAGVMPAQWQGAVAGSCPELKIIFARGSGAERWTNDDFVEFRARLTEKLAATTIDYEVEDLDYPAVGIGIDNLNVLVGAAVGSGDAYEFGESVDAGVERLKNEVNETCAETKYVLAGYSQGAMVVSKSLPMLNADKIIYAATFGDPKIYLPEGKPPVPDACFNRKFSEYREYVPDCLAYKGLLGAYIPYQPDGYSGKLGTWCNNTDIFCSAYVSIASHTAYVADEVYKAASEKIFEKILAGMDVGVNQDIIVLFNADWVDDEFFDNYREAALKFSKNALATGARVAVYFSRTYRSDGAATAIKICGFDECDVAQVEKYFNEEIRTYPCSADDELKIVNNIPLAAFIAITRVNWRFEAEKILVVYSKNDYDHEALNAHQNDMPGGVRMMDGEVNLEAVDHPSTMVRASLAARSGMEINTEVAEVAEVAELPEVEINNIQDNGTEVTVEFMNFGNRTVVTLNDIVLGMTTEEKITITGLNRQMSNIIRLVAINEARRGNGVEIVLDATSIEGEISAEENDARMDNTWTNDVWAQEIKAPNAGRQ